VAWLLKMLVWKRRLGIDAGSGLHGFILRFLLARGSADTPMKRPAQPEEIAPAFVFLAAPSCSSYITGEVLPIIGGYSGG
jgi:NAD(P)-dependent dehydrogenase (short-subunit alcohol dehydrogenase family)